MAEFPRDSETQASEASINFDDIPSILLRGTQGWGRAEAFCDRASISTGPRSCGAMRRQLPLLAADALRRSSELCEADCRFEGRCEDLEV